jgi:hypothetical protein
VIKSMLTIPDFHFGIGNVIENLSNVYAQPLFFDIPCTWLYNQPHPSSLLAKNIDFLLLQLSHDNDNVQHMEYYAFILMLVSLVHKN